MTKEATLFIRTAQPIPFTVANVTGIEKGALLKLTDPMTAIISTAKGNRIAGIAASEKIASDGKVRLGVYRQGIFRAYCSGSITAGDGVISWASASGDNFVGSARECGVAISGSSFIGTSLEDATAGQTFLFDLNIGAGGTIGAA